jgi:hypothetical protein
LKNLDKKISFDKSLYGEGNASEKIAEILGGAKDTQRIRKECN